VPFEAGNLKSQLKEDYPPVPFPYKRILCPVDFDQYSTEALKEAAVLALSSAGTVHVLHVVQINPLVDQGAAEGFAAGELYEAQIQFARKRVEQMLTAMPPEVKREVMIEIGEPGNSIIDAQAKLGADLVVMATHGRKGLKHVVLGSVAERVVRESRVPVLTVRPAHRKRSE
jgi:universal stress protein A